MKMHSHCGRCVRASFVVLQRRRGQGRATSGSQCSSISFLRRQISFIVSPTQYFSRKFEVCWNKHARKIFFFFHFPLKCVRFCIHQVSASIVLFVCCCRCTVNALISFRVGNGCVAPGVLSAPFLLQRVSIEVAGAWDLLAYHP